MTNITTFPKHQWLACFAALIFLSLGSNLAAQTDSPSSGTTENSAPIRFVPFDQVKVDDPIWKPRIHQLVNETLPHAFRQTEVAQKRLLQCAQWLESGGKTKKPSAHRFNTSDLYKVMEGAALMIKTKPNPEIEKKMDQIIDVIARAQKEDGYLYVSHITGNIKKNEMGHRPYSYVLHSHELYNVGHLYEAAVAYARATGKKKLLRVAEKNARHIYKVFFLGDPNYNDGRPVLQAPGHQEIELGLVKLYNYTGKKLYLEMAKRFLDIRGVTFKPNGSGVSSPEYAQQHLPAAKQTEAVGHAVRATYQYAAMAEVDSLLDSDDFSMALDAIWSNITNKRMHITGGLGAVHGIEGFGPNYVLPNKHTYLETCAAVGNVFFNMRMFLKHKDARYLDVAEVALYNNCLSGVGLDGISFFYPNPLEADPGHRTRSGWFGTACCPSNIARLIPQVPGYLYAVEKDRIFCTLYAQSSTKLNVNGTKIGLKQTTAYPWHGKVEIKLDLPEPTELELLLRIPSWAKGKFLPGELYYSEAKGPSIQLSVNGKSVLANEKNGFLSVRRNWNNGDTISLNLPMNVQVNRCHENVKSNRGRIAISKGPILFCAEGIDNKGGVSRFFVQEKDALKASKLAIQNGSLKGLPKLTLTAFEKRMAGNRKTNLEMVPYFAWSNRDRSSMVTWLPTSSDLAKVDLFSEENLKFQSVTASHTFSGDTTEAIRFRHQPNSSFDQTIRRWTSWPQKGREQFVDIKLKSRQTIRSIGTYFYDDKGGVQVPKQWWIEIPTTDGKFAKLNIYNTDQYSTLKDNFNTVHPAKETTVQRFRIVMIPKHSQTTVGLLSVFCRLMSKPKKKMTGKTILRLENGLAKKLLIGTT